MSSETNMDPDFLTLTLAPHEVMQQCSIFPNKQHFTFHIFAFSFLVTI